MKTHELDESLDVLKNKLINIMGEDNSIRRVACLTFPYFNKHGKEKIESIINSAKENSMRLRHK